MNLLLLPENISSQGVMTIDQPRHIQHLHQVLKVTQGDIIKCGIRQGERFLAEIQSLDEHCAKITAITSNNFIAQPPQKLPVTLIIALPRPKVLRRIVQDATAMGVQKIVIMHSYHVDKSYWSSPILQQLDDAVVLGLEQAQDTICPEIIFEKRFKPFVEDRLAKWINVNRPAYVAHPYAQTSLPFHIQHECILIVGCERGFIPYEIDLLQKIGCQVCQFGSRILRTENSVSYALGRLF